MRPETFSAVVFHTLERFAQKFKARSTCVCTSQAPKCSSQYHGFFSYHGWPVASRLCSHSWAARHRAVCSWRVFLSVMLGSRSRPFPLIAPVYARRLPHVLRLQVLLEWSFVLPSNPGIACDYTGHERDGQHGRYEENQQKGVSSGTPLHSGGHTARLQPARDIVHLP